MPGLKTSEYGFDFHSGTCPLCGAGMHNNYQHDNNCLNNAFDCMPQWRAGWGDMMAGRAEAILHSSDYAPTKGYMMGAACAAKKLHEERLQLRV